MQRSEFLRTTTLGGLGVLSAATCVSPLLLAGCASMKYVDGIQTDNTIVLPIATFSDDDPNASGGATASAGASGTGARPHAAAVIVRKSVDMKGPIYVVREADNTYAALSLVCTHKGCIVRPVGAGFECPCHGSEFSADGIVLSPPAKTPLERYTVTSDGKNIYIKL